MASATFTLENTPETLKELHLLLQLDDKASKALGKQETIVVECTNLLEDSALHVLSRAISNHGFTAQIATTSFLPTKHEVVTIKPPTIDTKKEKR